MVELTAVQARVVGSLIEKELTTPQHYPLTLNALVMACNQTSNRDPVVTYDETAVSRALDELKAAGLLRFVHPSHGRSVTRYRQVLDEVLGLDARELAVLAVLLLRGPQTVGELRTRTERMADFAGLVEVEAVLAALAARDEPLALRLERQPGQRDARTVQLLTGAYVPGPSRPISAVAEPERWENPPPRPVADPDESLTEEIAALRAEVAALRDEVAALRASFE